MWGYSYEEISRKAQEAAAAAALDSNAWSTTGLFNLDSMRGTTDGKDEAENGEAENGETENGETENGADDPTEATTFYEATNFAEVTEAEREEDPKGIDDGEKGEPVVPDEGWSDHGVFDLIDNSEAHAQEAVEILEVQPVQQGPSLLQGIPEKDKGSSDPISSERVQEHEEKLPSDQSNHAGSTTPTIPAEPLNEDKAKDDLSTAESVPKESSSSQPPAPILTPPVNTEKETKEELPLAKPAPAPDQDALIARFSQQIKRLEEAHAAEMADMEQRHAQALKAAPKGDGGRADQLREELYQSQREKANMKQQLETLQKEKQEIELRLQSSSKDVGKANALHKRDLKILQEQLMEREQKASQAQEQVSSLKNELEKISTAHKQLSQTHEEFTTRTKKSMIELADRRKECRELAETLQGVSEEKDSLHSQLESLRLQMSNYTFNRTEQVEHVQVLRQKVQELDSQLQRAEHEHVAAAQKLEYALKEYKKRAQHELALSQSRSASAVQAKEEAELEARAARTTADAAMERAVKAEILAKHAVAEQKLTKETLERETKEAVTARKEAEQLLATTQAELKQRAEELEKAITYKEKVDRSLANSIAQYEAEAEQTATLQKQLATLQKTNKNLNENLEQLRRQLEKTNESQSDIQSNSIAEPEEVQQFKSTIKALEQELLEANLAIEDLKDALKHSLPNESSREGNFGSDVGGGSPSRGARSNHNPQNNNLFYAMEKQAELKTAQAEINRLANLLADFQSERAEAFDRLAEYKQRMEKAEARLERYNKLVPSKDKPASESTAAPTESSNVAPSSYEPDSAATNIEYLKNIVMRFLSAKTVQEKRALLPVIGAVLCLTPDELGKASAGFESSAGGESLASTSSFFKSLIKK